MNPWEEISLSDYEKHMSLESVKQLQALNEMMKKQFEAYPVSTAMVFGIAGGNGLEHVNQKKYKKIFGIDISEEYLAAVKERYSYLKDTLECHKFFRHVTQDPLIGHFHVVILVSFRHPWLMKSQFVPKKINAHVLIHFLTPLP